MSSKHTRFIQDVLITIHVNIRELKDRRSFADPEELTHIEAKILAYQEVLAVLRMSADEFGIDRQEIGL